MEAWRSPAPRGLTGALLVSRPCLQLHDAFGASALCERSRRAVAVSARLPEAIIWCGPQVSHRHGSASRVWRRSRWTGCLLCSSSARRPPLCRAHWPAQAAMARSAPKSDVLGKACVKRTLAQSSGNALEAPCVRQACLWCIVQNGACLHQDGKGSGGAVNVQNPCLLA